jgi:hypothetical protein
LAAAAGINADLVAEDTQRVHAVPGTPPGLDTVITATTCCGGMRRRRSG